MKVMSVAEMKLKIIEELIKINDKETLQKILNFIEALIEKQKQDV